MKKISKKNTFMIVMMVILSLSLVGAVSFIVYDKVIKKDEGSNAGTKVNNNNQKDWSNYLDKPEQLSSYDDISAIMMTYNLKEFDIYTKSQHDININTFN